MARTHKYVIACPPECSMHPDKIGEGKAELLLILKENGAGRNVFARRAGEVLGHPVPLTNAQRHLNHYKEAAPDPEDDPETKTTKATDLEILDAIIVAGYRNSRNWKPSIKDTLDAMKLKVQMTGNSSFDDLIALFDSADEDEEGGEEAEEAVLSPEERSDESDEDLEALPEPLL